MISNEELLQGLDRIARTADGELLYLYLQRILMEVPTNADPQDSALRREHGRRSLAAELIGRMAQGMSDSGGRTEQSTDGTRRERPLVFVSREPVNVGHKLTARQHIARNDPELNSFTVPADKPASSGGDAA